MTNVNNVSCVRHELAFSFTTDTYTSIFDVSTSLTIACEHLCSYLILSQALLYGGAQWRIQGGVKGQTEQSFYFDVKIGPRTAEIICKLASKMTYINACTSNKIYGSISGGGQISLNFNYAFSVAYQRYR
jgi:hypothetical protein